MTALSIGTRQKKQKRRCQHSAPTEDTPQRTYSNFLKVN